MFTIGLASPWGSGSIPWGSLFIARETPDEPENDGDPSESLKGVIVILEIPGADTEAVGYESILKDGKAVGYVTSAAFGHCIAKSLAAGYVPAALAREGQRFDIDVFGEMRAALVRLQPLHDPQGLRLRS